MHEKILLLCVIMTGLVSLRDAFTLPMEASFWQRVTSALSPIAATTIGANIAWFMSEFSDRNRFDFTSEWMACTITTTVTYFILRRYTRYETTFWQGVEHLFLSFVVGIMAALVANIAIWNIKYMIIIDHTAKLFFVGSCCLVLKILAALRPSNHTRPQS